MFFLPEPSETDGRLRAEFLDLFILFFPPFQASIVDLGVLPAAIVFSPVVPSVFFLPSHYFSLTSIPRVAQFIFSRGYFLSRRMKRPGRASAHSSPSNSGFVCMSSVWTKTLGRRCSRTPPVSARICVLPQRASIRAGDVFVPFHISNMRTAATQVKDARIGRALVSEPFGRCSVCGKRPPLCSAALSSVSHRAVASHSPLHMCQLVSWPSPRSPSTPPTPSRSLSVVALCIRVWRSTSGGGHRRCELGKKCSFTLWPRLSCLCCGTIHSASRPF